MLKKILVIDDSVLLHRVYVSALRRHTELGLTLLLAWNGMEGWTLLQSNPDTDLILLDVNMPVMNGHEFLEWRRRDAALARIPIIMCSTEKETDDVQRALAAGATAYLTKPFVRDDLYRTIEQVAGLGALPVALQAG